MFARAGLALVAASLCLGPSALAASGDPHPFSLVVGGEIATGLVAYPATARPDTLVVLCHGHGYTASSLSERYPVLADRGAVVVGMDYRGDGGFNVQAGMEDTVAATREMLQRFPTLQTVYLYGVSMGGEVSGMALAEAPELYDYWVVAEGLSNLSETWAEAVAVGDPAQQEIERETGGTPLTVPAAYIHRSPALHACEMDVRRAILCHGVADGMVTYDQGREMELALIAADIDTDFYTVVTSETAEDTGTTLFGALGLPNPLNLAGHSDEATRQTVVELSFDALYELMDLGPAAEAHREFTVDATLGTLP